MRLFAALVPPDGVLTETLAALDDVRADHTDLRWTPEERVHLTLAFYGDVADRLVDRLGGRLARVAARYPAPTLAFAGAGAFTSPRRARVLWLGVRGDTEQLVRLAQSAAAAGRRLGLDVGDEKYRPHLTVARAKQQQDLRVPVQRLADYQGEQWQAERLALVRSHLGADPQYETVVSWPLDRG